MKSTPAQELQDALDSFITTSGGMGVSGAVIMPDGKIWLGVSGMSDPTKSEAITPDMLFDMGSTGKNLFAPLVLKLVEEGLLSLDDSLRKYLPSYPNVDSNITIRQLLNHISGLYHLVEHPQAPTRIPYNSIDFKKWWTTEEIFDKLIKEPYFPPGKGWHYSQTGYILGTLIVEQITQSKVSMEIQKRLLDPLNIHGMLLDLTEPIPSHFKIAHNWVDTDRDGIPEDVSSRSRNWINSLSRILFYTRAEDLARWSHALYHGEVLSQASLGEMLSFHSPCPGEPLVAGYGLGVMKFSCDFVRGEQVWGHTGSIPGYRAFLGYLPKHDVSMSVLSNSDCSDEVGGRLITALLKIIVNHLNPSRLEEISL